MQMHSFDWSGADTHSSRLQTLPCYQGASGGTPSLQHPVGVLNWRRVDVVDWLVAAAAGAAGGVTRPVVGMDFPFAFPWAATGNQFATGQADRQALWEHVHATVWPNGVAQQFVNAHQALFDQSLNRVRVTGAHYVNHRRATELAGQAAGHRPLGVYNLCGVSPGKGAICGIAALQEVTLRCRRAGTPLVIWPFFRLDTGGNMHAIDVARPLLNVPAGCLVIVETYPKVFWNQCGQRLEDRGVAATWDAVRHHFGNGAVNPPLPANPDRADALVAWYGVTAFGSVAQLLTPSPALLAAHQANAQVVGQEGWIVGL